MTIVESYQNVDWGNVSNFTQFIQAVNQSSGNYVFMAIDLLVFLVLFISLAGAFGWESAILSAGFIGIILSMLFSWMNVLSWTFTGIFVGIIIIMIMYVMWSNRYD